MSPSVDQVALIGAGVMGRYALKLLAHELPDTRIRAVDRSDEALQEAAQVAPGRIEIARGDAREEPELLAGSDLVINCAGPFNTEADEIPRAAIRAGARYIDLSDDIEGCRAALSLDGEARSAGVVGVTGGGFSPGISNLVALDMVDRDPSIDGIEVQFYASQASPGGLAPLKHVLHMAESPCPQWHDGALVHTKGFSPRTASKAVFPDPIGETEVYDSAHPEPVTLSKFRPGLRYIGVKGSLGSSGANRTMATLARVGFGDPSLAVQLDGQAVDHQEVLWRVLWARHGRRRDARDGAICAVQVVGLRGREAVERVSFVDDADMDRTTAIGLVAMAVELARLEAEPGMYSAEVLPPGPTIERLRALCEREGALPNGIQSRSLTQ